MHGAPEVSLALVDSIERAVKDDRLATLATTMAELHEHRILSDPSLYPRALTERYARRLIWSDPANRFVVVAITWAPGQSAPLHDHDGLWGAEIVVSGTMRETTYGLAERDENDRFRFVREDDRLAPKGAVSVLSPPHEYHTLANDGTTTAHTLHVYSGALTHAHVFTPEPDGWWQSERMQLRYNA